MTNKKTCDRYLNFTNASATSQEAVPHDESHPIILMIIFKFVPPGIGDSPRMQVSRFIF